MTSIYLDITEMIREGDLDENLESLRIRIVERQQKIGQRSRDFDTAQRVRVIGKLKPNYLLGHDFPVNKRNPKSIVVAVPDTCKWCDRRKDSHDVSKGWRCVDRNTNYKPKFGRFAGSSTVRIPKSALEVVS